MAQQATQGIETAIVLAPADSLTDNCDSSLELAFRASLPELLALPKDKLLTVNVDVQRAVCLGLGLPERLRPWRNRILDELPRFDVNALDRIEQYAKTLMQAQVEYTLARKSPADIRALSDATQCRYQVLLNDARALAGRGLLAPEQLAKFTGCRRRVDRALALSALVSILKAAWPCIEGKTALTLTELERADEQVMQLMLALAHQKKPLKELARIAEVRQRAFTLFATAHAQVRRAVRFLCPNEEEAERIVPSLYPRKRAARKAQATPAGVTPSAERSSQPTTGVVPVAETSSQPKAAHESNPPQCAAPSIRIVVTPATLAATAASEPTTESAAPHLEVMNRPLGGSVPQQPIGSEATPETAATQRPCKRRRRPTKRERFLRSLGITAHGHG